MVMHAARTTNRYLAGPDIKTAYRRWKGKDFKCEVTELAECIVGVRGFRSREYVSAPVRVDWLGVCFCRRVLLFVLLAFFLLSLTPDGALNQQFSMGEGFF